MNRLTIVAAIVMASLAIAPGVQAQNARPWDVYEVKLEAKGEYSNPYVDGLPDSGTPLVQAVFIGAGGAARGMRYTLAGFWDGDKTWKVRFAPPAPGEWTWSTTSRDLGLNGAKGRFQCSEWTEAEKRENPARRGFIHVSKTGDRPGRYFEYADGTPFLWIGDTWWYWGKPGVLLKTFQRLADDRAAKGFTVGQISFEAMLDRTSYNLSNVEQLRKVEEMISYANSKGITVWINPWWSRKGQNQTAGEEKARRWFRYVMHRFGAHNVIFVLAGEYNMNNYGGFGLPFWKSIGAMVQREDPYHRIVGTHVTPPAWSGGAEAPQWSTGEVLHNEPWLDYNQSQTGHARWRNEIIPQVVAADYARKPAKPIVVTEPWYEFIAGNPTGMDIRFGAWSAILSGAAGHSYGGGQVWIVHVPEAPVRPGTWPLDTSFETNTMDYPGAVSMGFLARFLKGIEWWKLEPHPELVSEYSARYCSAVPGSRYLVYLRYGGALKLDLRSSRETDQFEYTWIDLDQSKELTGGKVNGGALREFHTPEDYPSHMQLKDWLLHVRRVVP